MKFNYLEKPVFLTSVLFLALFVSAEAVGLLVLHHTGTPHTWLVLFDLFIVVVALMPFIFFFVYRPMAIYCKKNNQLILEKEIRIEELEKARGEIKHLRGFLRICASCKKIKDDDGNWHQIESYIRDNSGAEFSHGLCPPCGEKLYPELEGDKTKIESER